jgi:hypothetical protein
VKIAAVVEGHGDAKALPILVRRIAERVAASPVEVLRPMRVAKSKLVMKGELERAVEFVARQITSDDGIVILADADDDCPGQRGPELLARARNQRRDRRIAVVLARREYEAWFLAAAQSLRGSRGLPAELEELPDPEGVRDAKGWLASRMPRGYSETLDQPAFTAIFDLDDARRADSFDRMYRDLERLLTPRAPKHEMRPSRPK